MSFYMFMEKNSNIVFAYLASGFGIHTLCELTCMCLSTLKGDSLKTACADVCVGAFVHVFVSTLKGDSLTTVHAEVSLYACMCVSLSLP